ncbi:MAG: chitobiase/beta-hexosaminidase C-terminal domain-containing protein [Fibrobacterota bacterium]
MKIKTIALAICLTAFLTTVFGVTVQKRLTPEGWNDEVRVAIIWNDGTGSSEMPGGWLSGVGDIGESTKDFTREALYHLSSENIRLYHGQMEDWDEVTFESIVEDFDGVAPHTIIYIGAGWLWYQNQPYPIPREPYHILEDASENGVGIVSIGDDAAYDGQYTFPLTGPEETGIPVQYDSNIYPAMNGATGWDVDAWITTVQEDRLLWSLDDDTLHFNDYAFGGRGQLDADIWSINPDDVDDYFFSGYQQKGTSDNRFEYRDFGGGTTMKNIVGSTPFDTLAPLGDRGTYDQGATGYSYFYTVLAGLQFENNRLAVLCFQPQYLRDEDAAAQIIYNSVYWASKGIDKNKIATPEADPAGGNVSDIPPVTLSVEYPKNTDLFTLRYTLDGTDPTPSSAEYSGPIALPQDQGPVTLKAQAFASNTEYWTDSDIRTVVYEAQEKKKIATPRANPAQGNTQTVETIELSVSYPDDEDLYEIRYTLDESSPVTDGTAYTGSIDFPDNPGGDVVLKAVAISQDPENWLDSDILEITYPYVEGPRIDSAHFYPGKIVDFENSLRDDDTIHIFFNTTVESIESTQPFILKDQNDAAYGVRIDDSQSDYSRSRVSFISTEFINKNQSYLPKNLADSIKIDPAEDVYSREGVLQDGTNNPFAFLRVFPLPVDLEILYTWVGEDHSPQLQEIIDETALDETRAFDEGGLFFIDPRTLITREEARKMDCRITILDAVGNVVQELGSIHDENDAMGGTLLRRDGGRYLLAAYWNGTNTAGRRVGGSAYSAQIIVTDPQDKTHRRSTAIYAPAAE